MISETIKSDVIKSWLTKHIEWTAVVSKASEQDVSASEPESVGKEEEKEGKEEDQSEEERVEVLDVPPPKTKKKKSTETPTVSKATAASPEVARIRTKYPGEKRAKRGKT